MSNLTAETYRFVRAVLVPGVVGPVDVGEPVAVLVGPDLSVVVGVEVWIGIQWRADETNARKFCADVVDLFLNFGNFCSLDMSENQIVNHLRMRAIESHPWVAGVAGEPRLGEDAVAVAGPLLEHAALWKRGRRMEDGMVIRQLRENCGKRFTG